MEWPGNALAVDAVAVDARRVQTDIRYKGLFGLVSFRSRMVGGDEWALALLLSPANLIAQMNHKSGLFVALALAFLVAHVTATYIMDDRNTTIAYSPLGRWLLGNDNISYYDTLSVSLSLTLL
jgi:hypothetical protein